MAADTDATDSSGAYVDLYILLRDIVIFITQDFFSENKKILVLFIHAMTTLTTVLDTLLTRQDALSNAIGGESIGSPSISNGQDTITKNDVLVVNGVFEQGKGYVVIFTNQKTREIHDSMGVTNITDNTLKVVVPGFEEEGLVDMVVCIKGSMYSVGKLRYIHRMKTDELEISAIVPGKASVVLPYTSFGHAPSDIISADFSCSDPIKDVIGSRDLKSSLNGNDVILEFDSTNLVNGSMSIMCDLNITDATQKTVKIPLTLKAFGVPKYIDHGRVNDLLFSWEGRVFSYGTPTLLPNKRTTMKNINDIKLNDIKKLACTDTTCLLLTSSGSVLTVGKDVKGCLGVGDENAHVINPVDLVKEGFLPDCIVDIGCGNNHCIAVDMNGIIYTWGDNSSSQCGRVGTLTVPQQIVSGEKFYRVFANGNTSMAITKNNDMYAWGRVFRPGATEYSTLNTPTNFMSDIVDVAILESQVVVAQYSKYTQKYTIKYFGLDPSTGNAVSVPTQLYEDVKGDKISLRSGASHVVAHINSDLLVFGDNSVGQIGAADIVVGDMRHLDIDVRDVMCGENFTSYIKHDGSVFITGAHEKLYYRIPSQILVADMENSDVYNAHIERGIENGTFRVGFVDDNIPVETLFINQLESFPRHVSSSNRFVALSYPTETVDGIANAGAVVTYDRYTDTYQTFYPPERQDSIFFGGDFAGGVAFSDTEIFIGSKGYINSGSSQGAVFVYERNGDVFENSQIITPLSPNGATFGRHVYHRGMYLCVGYPHWQDKNGRIDIYQKPENSIWEHVLSLDGDSGEELGHSMWISNDNSTVLIGAPWKVHDDSNSTGAVYMITKNASGQWSEKYPIPSPSSSQPTIQFSVFGYTMAAYENADKIHLFIGSPWSPRPGIEEAGCIFYYTFDKSAQSWDHTMTIWSPKIGQRRKFGSALDCSETGILVIGDGDNGSYYTYKIEDNQLNPLYTIQKDINFARDISVSPDGSITSILQSDDTVQQVSVSSASKS